MSCKRNPTRIQNG